MLCIVKCIEENRMLVYVYSRQESKYIQQQYQGLNYCSRKTPGSIYRSYPSLVRKNHLLMRN